MWFGDRSQWPDLKLDTDPENQPDTGQSIPCSSTPHHGAKPINQIFDISHIPPLSNSPQDTATIAAEDSAAAAAQASKEFLPDVRPKDYKVQGWILS